mgnify:CR=1 FL=1
MTKRANAKYKIDRRMGENIWGRPKSPVNKREYGPGQHGQRRKGKMSDFGTQLKAKQKLKGYYANLSERQFRKTYDEAVRLTGDSSENLIGLLERRLDAAIAGLASSSHAASAWAAYISAGPPPIWIAMPRISPNSSRVPPDFISASTWRLTQGSQRCVTAIASATNSRCFLSKAPSAIAPAESA